MQNSLPLSAPMPTFSQVVRFLLAKLAYGGRGGARVARTGDKQERWEAQLAGCSCSSWWPSPNWLLDRHRNLEIRGGPSRLRDRPAEQMAANYIPTVPLPGDLLDAPKRDVCSEVQMGTTGRKYDMHGMPLFRSASCFSPCLVFPWPRPSLDSWLGISTSWRGKKRKTKERKERKS